MTNNNLKNIVGLIIVAGFSALSLVSLIGCEQRKEVISITVESGAVKNNQPVPSAQLSKDAAALMADKQSGIVSFEFSSPQVSAPAKTSLTREELVRSMADSLAGIEDDMKAKNKLIDLVSGAGFKLTAAEFIILLEAARISDAFYYANAVGNVVSYLAYPLSERDMWRIAGPVADEHYRYKLLNDLKREQEKNQ